MFTPEPQSPSLCPSTAIFVTGRLWVALESEFESLVWEEKGIPSTWLFCLNHVGVYHVLVQLYKTHTRALWKGEG